MHSDLQILIVRLRVEGDNKLCADAASALESLYAAYQNAERRAEDAESRNVFLETEIAALAEKVKK
jgi:hypothetical protein